MRVSSLSGYQNVQLYSTNKPSQYLVCTDEIYQTSNCLCHICNIACRECGNVAGYHVVKPCHLCLNTESCNGHLWVFRHDEVKVLKRCTEKGEPIYWNQLTNLALKRIAKAMSRSSNQIGR